MRKDIKIKFAERLKELRAKHELTQQRLAALAKVDYKHIQRLESKAPPAARIDTIEKLAHAFRISLAQLVEFDD